MDYSSNDYRGSGLRFLDCLESRMALEQVGSYYQTQSSARIQRQKWFGFTFGFGCGCVGMEQRERSITAWDVPVKLPIPTQRETLNSVDGYWVVEGC